MTQFSIIQPQTTTNIVTNPSVEAATTGYTAVGSGTSIARSSTKQKRGAYSLGVTVTGTTTAGAYYGTVATTSGQNYTLSVDVWAPVGMLMTMYVGSTGGAVISTPTTWVGTGYWQRIENTYTESSSTSRRLYVTKNTDATTGTFYLDGYQFENLAYATTYCDGRQKGCVWSGAIDGSTSSRSSQERSGGKKITLESLNAYLVSQEGTGMPGINHSTTPYGMIDGSFYQRPNIKERTFTIAASLSGTSVASWHVNRQTLIDLIKPDLVYPIQPFVLTYEGGGKEVRISCYYDGGLEMADGKREIETIAIRCLSVDPYWRFDGNAGTSLTNQTSVSGANYLLKRDPGTAAWSIIGSAAPNGAIYTMGYDSIRDYLYVAGNFTTIGGISATDGFARFDGTSWTAMNGLNTTPLTIVVGADGTVYADAFIGSTFNLGYWTLGGSSWSKLGAGNFNNLIWSIRINPVNGYVWVVGDFTTTPSGAAVRVSYWNGSSWNAISTGLTGGTSSGRPFDIIFSQDGLFAYITGYFTTAGGVTVNGITRTDGSTFTALGSGIAGGAVVGYFFARGLDGSIYLSGNFTSISGIVASNIARYNGSGWSNLGSGIAAGFAAPRLAIDPTSGVLLELGSTSSGTYAFLDNIGIWNGSSWNSVDLDIPGSPSAGAIFVKPDGTLILGFDSSGTAIAGGVTSVTNAGTSTAYPEITINGPTSGTSKIYLLRNLTTGKTIYFDLTLNVSEIATLSLIPGSIKFTSNFRGNLMNTIRPGSEVTNFGLNPGVNSIEFQTASSTVVATPTWIERCYSIDSSGV